MRDVYFWVLISVSEFTVLASVSWMFFDHILFCSWTFNFLHVFPITGFQLFHHPCVFFFLFVFWGCLTDSFIYAYIFSFFLRCVGIGIVFLLMFVLFLFFLGSLPIFILSTVSIFIFFPEFQFLIKDFFSSFLFIFYAFIICHQR